MIALYQWDPSKSSLRNSPLGNKGVKSLRKVEEPFWLYRKGFLLIIIVLISDMKRRGVQKSLPTSSPGEALSTFSRASRDPKGETQLRVAKSTKGCILIGKTKPKHFPNDTKTNLKKSRKRLFWPSKWSKMSISRLFQSCFGLVWEVFGLCFRC